MEFINQYMQVIIAAIALLIVLLVILLIWRAVSPVVKGRRGQRLGVSEYHELDKTRRLVLVRRDGIEHLIMIGGTQDIVIEAGIAVPGQSASYQPPPTTYQPTLSGYQAPSQGDLPPAAGTARPAPRPAIFGERQPPPLRSVEPGGRDDDR
jgi:hypothetical protein